MLGFVMLAVSTRPFSTSNNPNGHKKPFLDYDLPHGAVEAPLIRS